MNLKRSLALALSLLMILSVIPAFGAGETLDRISGANRWATAVEISQEGWDSANTVVLANGRNYPDALAGVSLAFALDAPILLTEADSLVAETKAEINRLGATKVVILGGTGVISAAVADEIEDMGLEIERISGTDRFSTAAAVAAKVAPSGSGTVVLAYGRGYADALAAASYAAINGYPILLTEKNSLPEATEQAIVDLGATKVIVVGGTGVIAADTVADLPGVVRVSGSNREATSVELAEYFALYADKYFVATGDGFADAITGAVLAAKEGTGILLVRGSFPAVVGDFFADNNVANAVVFGGTGSVSETVATAAAAKLVQAPSGIAGFVVDGLGDPVEDAVVGVAGREAKTDADGFYNLTGVTPGKYNVSLSKPGNSIVTVNDFTVAQNKVATLNLTLGGAIAGPASISGVVYDVDTLAGVAADVTIKAWNKTTGKWEVKATGTVDAATSKFTVTDAAILPNTEYQVTISKAVSAANLNAVYVAQTRTITTDAYQVANSFSQPFALKAVKPVTISGTALDKDGNKMDAVAINLYLGDDLLTTVNSVQGEYEFADLTLPSGNYTITTSLADNALYTSTVAVAEGVDKTHNIKLVAGYAFDFELGALPIGEVFVALGDTFEAQVYQGTTKVGSAVAGVVNIADDGLVDFTLTDLYPAGSYYVEISGNHIVTAKFPVTISTTGQSFAGRVALAGTVSGSVADSGAAAVAEASVKLVNGSGQEVATTKTDVAGLFEFTGVPVGTKYKVVVSDPDFVTKTSGEFAVAKQADTAVPAITLTAVVTTGQMTGYIREAGSMEIINTATVTFIDKDKVETDAPVAPTGEYLTPVLAPGTYTVLVENLTDHEIIKDTVTIVAGATPVVKHYLLTPGADASLTIKSVKNDEGDDVAIVDANFDLVDAYGNVWADKAFTGLPAGTYTLTVDAPAGYLDVERTITVAKGAALEINLLLVSSNTVTVPVYGYAFPGAPYTDAVVACIDNTGKLVGYATTDLSGEASFELVDGTYSFKVYADNHFVGESKATITETTTIDVIYVEIF